MPSFGTPCTLHPFQWHKWTGCTWSQQSVHSQRCTLHIGSGASRQRPRWGGRVVVDKVYIVTCDSVTEHVHHLGGNPPFLKSCPVHLTAESPWPSCLWLPCTFCTLCRGRGCMRSFCTSSPPSAGILRMVVTVVTEEGAIDHPTTHTTTHDGIGERREDFHSLLLLPGLPIVPLHSRRGSSIAFHTLILRCSKCHISALSARGTISFPWIPTAQLQSRGVVDLRSQNWCTLNVMACKVCPWKSTLVWHSSPVKQLKISQLEAAVKP